MGDPQTVLNQIIDAEVEFLDQRENDGKVPTLKLSVAAAFDLAKGGRNLLGSLSEKVFREGIRAFETEGLFGMKVKIEPKRSTPFEIVA